MGAGDRLREREDRLKISVTRCSSHPMFWQSFPIARREKGSNSASLCHFSSSLADLFPILDRCDQEKHRAASFVPHFGMLVQHCLCGLRFGELRHGETSVNERIQMGGDSTMIFENIMVQKSCLTRTFILVMVDRPM